MNLVLLYASRDASRACCACSKHGRPSDIIAAGRCFTLLWHRLQASEWLPDSDNWSDADCPIVVQEEMFCDEFNLVDLRVFENCKKVCEGCDHVFNLAADMGGMGFIQSNHSVIMYNNTMISFNMLEAARQTGIQRCAPSCMRPGLRCAMKDVTASAHAAHSAVICGACCDLFARLAVAVLPSAIARAHAQTQPPRRCAHAPFAHAHQRTHSIAGSPQRATPRVARRFFYASSACIYPEGKQLNTEVEGGGLKEADAWPAQPQVRLPAPIVGSMRRPCTRPARGAHTCAADACSAVHSTPRAADNAARVWQLRARCFCPAALPLASPCTKLCHACALAARCG